MFDPDDTEGISADRKKPYPVNWEAVGGIIIPFISRDGVKLSEKRMVEKTLLKKYRPFFSDDVFDCMRPRAVRAATSELPALDHINALCNSIFLSGPYEVTDLLLEIDEVANIDTFLSDCYDVLVLLKEDAPKRWGFFSVDDSETLIPFVTVGGDKLVPLFYFELPHDLLLEHVVVTITDPWQLAYIKLSCKMQRVSKDLYDSAAVQAVSMSDLIHLVAEGSKFRLCWPEYFDCGLLKVAGADEHEDPTLAAVAVDAAGVLVNDVR